MAKAQYVKLADAICKKANERQQDLLKKEFEEHSGNEPPSGSEQESFVLNSGLPPLKEEATELDKLGAPTGQEEKAEALVDALEQAIGEIENEPLAFAKGESNAFVPVEALGEKLGLQLCGRP